MSPVQTYKCHLSRVGHSICVPGSHPTTSAPPDRGFRYLGVARWPPPRRTSARPPGSPLTRPSPTPASASGSILNLQRFLKKTSFAHILPSLVHRSCSWKCCFIFICLPLCYPCYITRTFRSIGSTRFEDENDEAMPCHAISPEHPFIDLIVRVTFGSTIEHFKLHSCGFVHLQDVLQLN